MQRKKVKKNIIVDKKNKTRKNSKQKLKLLKVQQGFFKRSTQGTLSTLASKSDPDRKIRVIKSATKNICDHDGYRCTSQFKQSATPKLSILLKENNFPSEYTELQGLSFREYMAIGQKWYPILTTTQRTRLCRISTPKFLKNRIRKQNSDPNESYTYQNQTFKEVNTISEQLKHLQQKLKIQKENNTSNIGLQQSKNQLCIQLKNLAAFLDKTQNSLKLSKVSDQLLSDNQNRHETSINSPDQIEKLQNDSNQIKQEDFDNQNSPVKSLSFSESQAGDQLQGQQIGINYQEIISHRQHSQLGYMNCHQRNNLQVSTDSLSIGAFIQTVYQKLCSNTWLKQIIHNLSMAYGFPKLKKYTRICSQKPLSNQNSQVLPQYLLYSVNEDYISNQYLLIHNQCLFDALNEELVQLKPFYICEGQCFPWSVKLSAPITFYDIHEESIGTAFNQAKQKVLTFSSILCGLLVQNTNTNGPSDQQKQKEFQKLICQRRITRQNHLIKQFLLDQNWSNQVDNQTQFESVRILTEISDQIFSSLLQQIHADIPFK